MNARLGSHAAAAALLERIVDAPCNLIVLDTTQGDDLIDSLRLLARRSGQAVYLWQHEVGLRSLREGDMQIQVSNRFTDTLRFIRRSMHFGIYLLPVDASRLSPQSINLLAEIGRLKDGTSRRVVLLGSNPVVDDRLESVSLRLSVSGGDQGRPRLRDGRWVR